MKVTEHTIAKSITQKPFAKAELKTTLIDSTEIKEENTVVKNQSSHEIINHTKTAEIKIKKAIKDKSSISVIPKIKHATTSEDRELNIPSMLSTFLVFLGIFLYTLALKLGRWDLISSLLFLCTFFIFVASFILSIVGLVQTNRHKEKYWGMGFAIFGLLFGLLLILMIAFLIYLLTHLSMA